MTRGTRTPQDPPGPYLGNPFRDPSLLSDQLLTGSCIVEFKPFLCVVP